LVSVVTSVAVVGASAGGEFYTAPVGEGLVEGISDNGVACGSFNSPEYFMWTVDGGLELIGGTVPGDGVGGQAKISNDGTRISGTYLNPVSGLNEFSYYDIGAATWNPLGGIGGVSGTETSSGWNISGDGQSVVGLGWVDAGGGHAVQWDEGFGVTDLGSTVPDRSTRANAVDYDGTVVGGWQDSATGFRQGAVWVDGVQELITDGDGGASSEVFDVSGDGQWASGYGVGGFFDPGQAYRYNTVTDTHEYIPNLAAGAERNAAGAGITDDGMTIVGGTWGFGPALFGNAFIWREGIGTIAMDEYLDEVGIAYPDGFHFAFASAISSDGEWIAGWGDLEGPASAQSWIVHIPEPASLSLLLVAAPLVLRRKK
jgi:hypothetical protein